MSGMAMVQMDGAQPKLIGGMEPSAALPKKRSGGEDRTCALLTGFIFGMLAMGLGIGLPWAMQDKTSGCTCPPSPPSASTEVVSFSLTLSSSRLRKLQAGTGTSTTIDEVRAAVAQQLNIAQR